MLRFRRLSALLSFAALLLAAAGVRPAAAQTFHRIDLPLPPLENAQSWSLQPSADGRVVLLHGQSPEGVQVYRWTAAQGIHRIGTFEGRPHLSEDGRVVTVLSTGGPEIPVYRWTEALGLVQGPLVPRDHSLPQVSRDGSSIFYIDQQAGPSDFTDCPVRTGRDDAAPPAAAQPSGTEGTRGCFGSGTETLGVWREGEGMKVLAASATSWTATSRSGEFLRPLYGNGKASYDGASVLVYRCLFADSQVCTLRREGERAATLSNGQVLSADRALRRIVGIGSVGNEGRPVEWTDAQGLTPIPDISHTAQPVVSDDGQYLTWTDDRTGQVLQRGPDGQTVALLDRADAVCSASTDNLSQTGDLLVGDCGSERYVWTRRGGVEPLSRYLAPDESVHSVLGRVITGAGSDGMGRQTSFFVLVADAPRLVVRDVARFGKASAPLAGVEVTIRGNVTAVATTGADGTIVLPDANSAGGFDPSQLADVRLRDVRTGLTRTFQGLRPSEIADTTLVLPVDLVRRLGVGAAALATSDVADLPILRQIGDAFLEYDTTGVRDLRAAWFRDLAETSAVHRQRDEHLGRLVSSVEGLVTLHASEAPLAGQVASVGVQAVTTLLSGQDALKQVESQIATDASGVFASSGGTILKAIALAVTQAGNSGLHGAYLAFTGTVESALPSPWNTAWSWLGEAATKGIGDGIASRSAGDGGSAFLSTLVETVVEKTAGPLVDAIYIGQTQDDLDAAARRARTFAGQGTPRAGFETSLTRANESAARLDARLSLSTAVLATAKGWADVGDLALVIGKVPGAQVAATMGLLIRSFSFGALAADEVLSVRALHRAASSDSPSLVALAYGLPPVGAATVEPPGPTAVRASSLAMGQATSQTVLPALDRYAAHLGAVRTAVQTGTRDDARVATDSLLRADSGLRRALDQTHAELSALAPASDAVASAQRRLLGRSGVLSGDGLRLYAGLLPHLVPKLAEDPDGVSTGGPLDGPMTGIADTVLARIPRVQVALDSLRAAFNAAQATRTGVSAPPTLVVTDPGVGLSSSIAPGTVTVRARVTNAGTVAADGVTVTFTADGDTTGGPVAVLRLTSAAAQAIGTLAPGQTVEATWTVVARDTSSSARGSSGLYRVETASTTAGAVTRRAVQRVGVSGQTGVGVEAERAGTSQAGIESVYPNPARQSVLVRYTLAAPSRVGIRVYDTLGREVARVADGEQAVGRHTAMLHVSALAAGVYVVRVDAGGASSSRVLTVVR